MCERLQYSWALTWLGYFLAIQVMGKEGGVRPADLSLIALDASYELHHPSYYPPVHANGSFIQSYPNRAILTTVTIACFKRESQEMQTGLIYRPDLTPHGRNNDRLQENGITKDSDTRQHNHARLQPGCFGL